MLRTLAFDRRRSALAFGCMGSLALVAVACVTSSDAPPGQSPDVDASTDAGSGADASPPSNGDGGDVPGCGPGRAICGASCVELSTSKEHCGRCDHDCGGGECVDSVCQPTMLVEHLPSTAALDVSEDAFFFTNESSVSSCPAAGCGNAPKLRCTVQGTADGLLRVKTSLVVRARPQTSEALRALFACRSDVESEPVALLNSMTEGVDGVTSNDAGGVLWATSILVGEGQTRLYGGTCTDAGCSSQGLLTSTPFVTDRLAANDAAVFYRSASQSTFGPAQDLWRYSLDKGGALPKVIGSINGAPTSAIAMRAFDDGVGVAINTLEGKTLQGQLFVCRQSAMGSACTLLGDPLPELRDFTLDAERLYFASDASIWTCPREGCKGSPPLLAKSSAIANDSLRTTSKYVYWLSGKDDRAIWRVAKP